MLIEKTLKDFIAELASDSPAPGGGSAAALASSISASLVSMVCNLTIGKEKYKEHETELQKVLNEAESLRKKLLQLIDKDTEAFMSVMAAFKLPKGSVEEKKIRSEAIHKAFIGAAELPLEVCRCCLKIIKIGEKIINYGNPNAASDAGVAVLMAGAGARGAAFNVQINLGSILDKAKKQELNEKLDSIMSEIEGLERTLLKKIGKKIRNL